MSDPRFVSPNDFRFRPDSPCINAGNLDSDFNNPDGSRNTMGAYGGPYSLIRTVADTDSDDVNVFKSILTTSSPAKNYTN